MEFVSLKKRQDRIQMENMVNNILGGFKNIYKYKTYYNYSEKKVPSLANKKGIAKFEFKSTEKTEYFDIFLCFIFMYIDAFKDLVKETSIPDQKNLIVPLNALAYIFSSQLFLPISLKQSKFIIINILLTNLYQYISKKRGI